MKFKSIKLKIATTLIVTILVALVVTYYKSDKNQTLDSRVFMLKAEQIVREQKPTPVQSSRFYAKVAKIYYDELVKSSDKNFTYDMSSSTALELLDLIKKEDEQVVSNKKIGAEYWLSNKSPFSPNADKLSRFILDERFDYKVPKPPAYNSQEFKDALNKVKEASENRTPEQGAAINFWGGVPGTEAPAGIWQNRLYVVTKKYNMTNVEYAYIQMVLAQSLADSFLECWKVKYTYWTKRPDMVDASIITAMPNPPFPSYVSGHSTISWTAATILSQFFPKEKDIFTKDADEAQNSRLWAGIHFPYDNEEGKNLGIKVGDYIVQKLDIKEIK